MNSPVKVEHYKGTQRSIRSQFEHDAKRYMQQGYVVESQEIIPGRRGCLGSIFGVLLLGIPLLLYRPRDVMVVTYRLRESPGI